jgi:predicted AAA+ superfamily ATPase
MEYVSRVLDLPSILQNKSCFLFGPRQTGKSLLAKTTLPNAVVYDLLKSDLFLTLHKNPSRLREEITDNTSTVVIDEIQRIPALLNEVHYLIENVGVRFLLTGSSARKLRRGGVNLLGGRARSRRLHPFVYKELESFDLKRALQFGLIPSIYLSDSPREDLVSYTGDYLLEEIAQEGLTRNIGAFGRFLDVAAGCNGQMLNFSKISSDAQVPTSTVREYFQILEDTLLAKTLPAWKKSSLRKPITTAKFYFFDVGVARQLQGRRDLPVRTAAFGEAFESYIFHELSAFIDYQADGQLHYWRSKSKFEVDFILNNITGIEVKAKNNVTHRDLKGIRALKEENLLKNYLVVSMEERPRTVENIQILPWETFLHSLWDGRFS